MPQHKIEMSCPLATVAVLVAALVASGAPANAASPIPAPIGYGETICDTISLPGEVHFYTLTASAGDRLLIWPAPRNRIHPEC